MSDNQDKTPQTKEDAGDSQVKIDDMLAQLESLAEAVGAGAFTRRFKEPRAANVEARLKLPAQLRSGPICVDADVHVRDWRREGPDLVLVPSSAMGAVTVSRPPGTKKG